MGYILYVTGYQPFWVKNIRGQMVTIMQFISNYGEYSQYYHVIGG